MPYVQIDPGKSGGQLFSEAFNPYLQLMTQNIQRKKRKMEDYEAEGRLEPAEKGDPGAKKYKGKYYTVGESAEQQRLGMAEQTGYRQEERFMEEQDTQLRSDAIKMSTKKGKFNKRDFDKNYKTLKEMSGRVTSGDVSTFVSDETQRNELMATNPAAYNRLLQSSQRIGKMLDIDTIDVGDTEIETTSTEEIVAPTQQQAPQSLLPPTAPPGAQAAERFTQGARPALFGQHPLQQQGRQALANLPSQAAGLAGTGYNALAGGLTGLSGVPQTTVPQEYLDVMRKGNLFSNPMQNIKQSGQALGQGVGVAGDFYKNLISKIMQRQYGAR